MSASSISDKSTSQTTATTTTAAAAATTTTTAPVSVLTDASSIDPSRILNINVGVLGHVDSGKTSLVKTLSTLLSTAALDKSQQSRQRGITLDLGFSAFLIPVPHHIQTKLEQQQQQQGDNDDGDDNKTYDAIQVTLVDCPGHASLIRTIIGGAQIIDMVLLVVDAVKGVQAQTTECIVVAELTCTNLIVALNKIDMFPDGPERKERLRLAERNVRNVLRHTRFYNAPMVGVSACVGGEKVAAVDTTGASGGAANASAAASPPSSSSSLEGKVSSTPLDTSHYKQTLNIDQLLHLLSTQIQLPKRLHGDKKSTPFHFAIDHCFPIRGQGTVLTGTVLSGTTRINDNIEFPTLSLQRKIKSIQMFHRKVRTIHQGDRAGVCVSNLDSKLMERGVAATPGYVRLLPGAVALVKKVQFYNGGVLKCGSKFHVSVGHATVMATVTFFGAKEIARLVEKKRGEQEQLQQCDEEEGKEEGNKKASDVERTKKKVVDDLKRRGGGGSSSGTKKEQQHQMMGSSSLGGYADIGGLPKLSFDYEQHFMHQDEMLEMLPTEEGANVNNTRGTNNIKVGGEDDDTDSGAGDGVDSELVMGEDPHPSREPPLHWALLDFQTPVYCPLGSLIIGSRLDVDGASASSCRLAFSGRLVEKFDPKKDANRIKIYTRKEKRGTICRLGDPHKRDDDGRIVRYEVYGTDLFKKETNMKQFVGMKIQTDHHHHHGHGDDDDTNNNSVGIIHSSFGTSGKFRVYFPAGVEKVKEGDALVLKFRRYAHDPTKSMHQDDDDDNGGGKVPKARPGTLLVTPKKGRKEKREKKDVVGGNATMKGGGGGGSGSRVSGTQTKKVAPSVTQSFQNSGKEGKISKGIDSLVRPETCSSSEPIVVGEIASLKGDILDNGKHSVAIVSGFFTPEINIREKVGMKVVVKGRGEEGYIAGPFGKAGKCKVTFEKGISAPVGTKVELVPP